MPSARTQTGSAAVAVMFIRLPFVMLKMPASTTRRPRNSGPSALTTTVPAPVLRRVVPAGAASAPNRRISAPCAAATSASRPAPNARPPLRLRKPAVPSRASSSPAPSANATRPNVPRRSARSVAPAASATSARDSLTTAFATVSAPVPVFASPVEWSAAPESA